MAIGQVVPVASITSGLPNFTIVGLPDTAVQESRERVRAAIVNSGFTFPRSRITVNLRPGLAPGAGPTDPKWTAAHRAITESIGNAVGS